MKVNQKPGGWINYYPLGDMKTFLKLDRLRSSVKLSCNQLFLDVFKVVDHTLPGLVSTAD